MNNPAGQLAVGRGLTYLTGIGQAWFTMELPAHQVAAGTTPAVVLHDGFVSVYTVNAVGHNARHRRQVDHPDPASPASSRLGSSRGRY
jgi:hypothetical protein